MLAYGVAADACDEYVRIGADTALKCLHKFTDGIINSFGNEYLRRPTVEDIQRLLSVGESRGFPGMLGSIDCMHWRWKNCPAELKGMYARGDHDGPTIILEAVASYDTWIWHAFFGTPGTANDINVLARSPVFDDVLRGQAPNVNFMVNGHEYTTGYYLADGIYPPWATFIPSIRLPQGEKAKLFAQQQERWRKDVERAFGALQSRFKAIRDPALSWNPNKIAKIMKTCIIIHNMIVEDERGDYRPSGYVVPQYDAIHQQPNNNLLPRDYDVNNYIERRYRIENRVAHHQLKEDLVEHVWATLRANHNNGDDEVDDGDYEDDDDEDDDE